MVYNSGSTVLAEETFLLAAFGRGACVGFEMGLCLGWKFECREHKGDAIGAAGLALALVAMANVDFERCGCRRGKAD